MPTIQGGPLSVAANATNDNVLANSQFEYLPYNARLDFGFCGSAAGLQADVYSGQDIVCESFALNANNRIPISPDDFTLRDIAAAGDRLKARIKNTTAGALNVFWSVIITPLGRR
ncbi:MAG: hypothetical protein ACREJC_07150 [Tepidisphaeraceae bacterium]